MQNNKINILLLLGTAREGRKSEAIFKVIKEHLESKEGIEVTPVDIKGYIKGGATVPAWIDSKETKEWKLKVENADAFILVVPEYNHGHPGELKILLDGAYQEYNKKPVLVCGVSSGAIGGARMVENIKPVLIELGLIPTKKASHVFRVEEYIGEDGRILDKPKKKYLERLEDAYQELLWMAKVFKEGKNNYKLKD